MPKMAVSIVNERFIKFNADEKNLTSTPLREQASESFAATFDFKGFSVVNY